CLTSPGPAPLFFFFYHAVPHLLLHSFPTRRSSDLPIVLFVRPPHGIGDFRGGFALFIQGDYLVLFRVSGAASTGFFGNWLFGFFAGFAVFAGCWFTTFAELSGAGECCIGN